MRAFTFDAPAPRVVFGAGALDRVPAELERLGWTRALVVSTPGQRALAETLAARLGTRAAGVHAGAVMHVPVAAARAARAAAAGLGADGVVAIGGGSAIGLAKALALEPGLPIAAVPTTLSGSEMTPIWGLTEDGVKRTGRDPRVLPRTVVYDPGLLAALPAAVAGPSGMNAIAHAVEALYAADANPVTSIMAEEAVRALAAALPRLADADARADALYGAWLAGACLGAVGMALHHKLCHALGGSFGLPHAETHAVILPYAVAYNQAAAPAAMAAIGRALGVAAGDVVGALRRLARAAGAPPSLAAIGMPETGLDRAADLAVQSPYPNPRPVERAAIRALLEEAFRGV